MAGPRAQVKDSSSMRAAVVDRYGPPEVVRVTDIDRPVPGSGEALIRVVATAVTSGDARIRGARFPGGFGVPARMAFGLLGPRRRVLGTTCSGTVEAVGGEVAGLAPGDAVCGMTGTRMGTHAEYVAVPVARLARKPPAVSHEQAAGVLFGGTAAWYFLHDKANVHPGATVLVNGASGAVGTNAVQLASYLGATVTAVTGPAHVELVGGLGADRVLDHTTRDVTALPDRFDVVLDVVGNLSIESGRRLLAPNGVLVLAVASLGEMLRARRNVVAGSAPERADDFERLLGLVADGTLRVPVERVLALDEIVDAYRLVDSGHKAGNVIVCP